MTKRDWDTKRRAFYAKLGKREFYVPLASEFLLRKHPGHSKSKQASLAGVHVQLVYWLLRRGKDWPWYEGWLRQGKKPPSGVTIATEEAANAFRCAWRYMALCQKAKIAVQLYDAAIRYGELPEDLWPWLFGLDDPPKDWVIIPELVYTLRQESTDPAICRAIGIVDEANFRTLVQWLKRRGLKTAVRFLVDLKTSPCTIIKLASSRTSGGKWTYGGYVDEVRNKSRAPTNVGDFGPQRFVAHLNAELLAFRKETGISITLRMLRRTTSFRVAGLRSKARLVLNSRVQACSRGAPPRFAGSTTKSNGVHKDTLEIMDRFAQAATLAERCKRARVTQAAYQACIHLLVRRARNAETDVRDLFERQVANVRRYASGELDSAEGQSFRHFGVVGDRLFAPAPWMWQFREVAISVIATELRPKQYLKRYRSEPSFWEWFRREIDPRQRREEKREQANGMPSDARRAVMYVDTLHANKFIPNDIVPPAPRKQHPEPTKRRRGRPTGSFGKRVQARRDEVKGKWLELRFELQRDPDPADLVPYLPRLSRTTIKNDLAALERDGVLEDLRLKNPLDK